MPRWKLEAWRKDEQEPYTSTYMDWAQGVGISVQVMLENGADRIEITTPVVVPVATERDLNKA